MWMTSFIQIYIYNIWSTPSIKDMHISRNQYFSNSPPEFKYWNSQTWKVSKTSIYKYFASHWF